MDHEELVKEFLIESYENLDRLDREMVQLEKAPQDRELLGSVFRTIHTIKGTCGFLGYHQLESLSHVGENLLSRLRDLEITLDADITTALLRMVDAIRGILASIETTRHEPDVDNGPLITELTRLGAPAAASAAPAAHGAPPDEGTVECEAASAVPNRAAAPPPEDDRRGKAADSSLRVDVTLLDKLMTLVGELVLARNQILQLAMTNTDANFVGATSRLNLVTSELQEGVMRMRMQPIGSVWSKFPRIVRDLATSCGKHVRVDMEGRETDLDKTIIEAIKDPLTHVVRNSVDHGIETPDERVRRGKCAEGVIRLRAYHEGGQINIEISDDGGGIDPARVRAKAVQRGLLAADRAARLSDAEAIRLIFLPGFSTADAITNVSGRGVGMDVVKTNIEKIGGQVDVHSTVGEGTTLNIKIPLTLAIIPALIVGSGADRYAIPQVSLLELVRLEGDNARRGVERVHDALFYRLRGNLLPLVFLRGELGLAGDNPTGDDPVNIVVLKAGDRQFGLVVESIHDTEEIVVKPLGSQLKSVAAFAGATIMGDGRVALILDVVGLAQRARVVSDAVERALTDGQAVATLAAEDAESLLVFRSGAAARMAMPLDLVARLEEIPRARIERSGIQDVVQYRGEIMPLVDLATFFTGTPSARADTQQVVVFTDHGRSVGLAVDQILDIVSERVTVRRAIARPGIMGTAVIQGKVADLLDAHAVAQAAHAAAGEHLPA